MRCDYLVVCSYFETGKGLALANTVIQTTSKIETLDEVREVEYSLKEEFGMEGNVVLLNFVLLKVGDRDGD